MYIGQLAAQLGINPRTIRFYEAIELLPKPQRDSKEFRVYTEEDKERLKFIFQAKRLGFTLEEISGILALRSREQEPCEQVVAMLDKKLTALDIQLRTLTKSKQSLQQLRQEATQHISSPARVCKIIEQHHTLDL